MSMYYGDSSGKAKKIFIKGSKPSAEDLLESIKSVDGAGSGLDADLLDGKEANAFAASTHGHPEATDSVSGFLPSYDKTKLNRINSKLFIQSPALSGNAANSVKEKSVFSLGDFANEIISDYTTAKTDLSDIILFGSNNIVSNQKNHVFGDFNSVKIVGPNKIIGNSNILSTGITMAVDKEKTGNSATNIVYYQGGISGEAPGGCYFEGTQITFIGLDVADNDRAPDIDIAVGLVTSVDYTQRKITLMGQVSASVLNHGIVLIQKPYKSEDDSGGAFSSSAKIFVAGYNNYDLYSNKNIIIGSNNKNNFYSSVILGDDNFMLDPQDGGTIGGSPYGAIILGHYNKLIGTCYNSGAIGDQNIIKHGGAYALGNDLISSKADSCVVGVGNDYNFEGAFTVGIGTSWSRSNGFRVDSAGKGYFKNGSQTSGADFGEFFEWSDGNPDNADRRGLLVTLDGKKIRPATAADDFILGIISGRPAIVGNAFDEEWTGKFVTDVFGTPVMSLYSYPAEYDEEGRLIRAAYERLWYTISPDYDSSMKYTSRDERQEWDIVGLQGQLVVTDDGSCQSGGYCLPGSDGIATATSDKRGYRVMERKDANHVLVYVHGRIVL